MDNKEVTLEENLRERSWRELVLKGAYRDR